MLSAGEIRLIETTMAAVDLDPESVAEIRKVLYQTADGIDDTTVGKVQPSWYGQSSDGFHRLGVNSNLAHEQIEVELKNLCDGFRAYAQHLQTYVGDMEKVTDDQVAAFTAITQATETMTATGPDAPGAPVSPEDA